MKEDPTSICPGECVSVKDIARWHSIVKQYDKDSTQVINFLGSRGKLGLTSNCIQSLLLYCKELEDYKFRYESVSK